MPKKFKTSYKSLIVPDLVREALRHCAAVIPDSKKGIDSQRLQLNHEGWRDLVDAVLCLVDDEMFSCEAVARRSGTSLLAQSVAYRLGVPVLTLNDHGNVEAEFINAKSVVLIEDELNDCEVVLNAVTALKTAGAKSVAIAALIDCSDGVTLERCERLSIPSAVVVRQETIGL